MGENYAFHTDRESKKSKAYLTLQPLNLRGVMSNPLAIRSAGTPGVNNNRFFVLLLTICVIGSILSEWYMLTSKLHALDMSHMDLSHMAASLRKDLDGLDKMLGDQASEHEAAIKELQDKARVGSCMCACMRIMRLRQQQHQLFFNNTSVLLPGCSAPREGLLG